MTPVMLSIMPTIGKNGIIGQMMTKIKLSTPPMIIIKVPAMSRTRREINPIKRETNLSKNIWNLRSKDAFPDATSADI